MFDYALLHVWSYFTIDCGCTYTVETPRRMLCQILCLSAYALVLDNDLDDHSHILFPCSIIICSSY